LQQAGHKPIVLMGGGTTKVGDPTGRDESRKMLSDEDDRANIASIRTIFERLLTFGDGPTDAVMVNNHDWLGKLGYIELLQRSRHAFHRQPHAELRFGALRLEREQPMTFLEFNYMILQGYDFRSWRKRWRAAADGRLGPVGQHRQRHRTDRRMDGTELFGLTTPLLTTADGAKMGKTAAGAVWLNEDALPATTSGSSGATPTTRRRPLPAPVHRPAAGRDRAAGSAGRRDQRGQEGAGQRGTAASLSNR
jgi:tyrosyl-tRNA synthetase